MADLSIDDQPALAVDQAEASLPAAPEAEVAIVAESGAAAGATTGIKAKKTTPVVPQAADEATAVVLSQVELPMVIMRLLVGLTISHVWTIQRLKLGTMLIHLNMLEKSRAWLRSLATGLLFL